jgi:dsRNA-specific ribonuclease
MKIFGDVFEAIVAAIFLDSKSFVKTKEVILSFVHPYLVIYSDLNTMKEHPRTVLLQLWNSKNYTNGLKISHDS